MSAARATRRRASASRSRAFGAVLAWCGLIFGCSPPRADRPDPAAAPPARVETAAAPAEGSPSEAATAPPALAPLVVTRLALGVRFQIAFVGEDDARFERVARSVFAEIDRLESIVNNWDPDSVVSRFNATRSVEWCAVAPELAAIVAGALAMHRGTEGAYDVTILPALEAYGFGERALRLPGPEELRAIANRVGSDKLEVRADPPAIRRRVEGVTIDVSSASKGYVVDRVVELLLREGVTNAFVSAGGSSVHAIGSGPDGSGWPFEIDASTTWRLRDEAVSTSGRSARDSVVAGERVGTIFDPRTLRPAARRVELACVRGPSGFVVDMASTALVVLGDEEGAKWFRRDPGLARCRAWIRKVDDPEPVEF